MNLKSIAVNHPWRGAHGETGPVLRLGLLHSPTCSGWAVGWSGVIYHYDVSTETTPPTFSDVPSNAWYKDAITKLVDKHIIAGYGDGTFKPGRAITRAEFAKMICLAMGWEPASPAPNGQLFIDVPQSHWAYGYITTVTGQAGLSGYPDGTFGPTRNITRAEITKLIAGALDLPPGTSALSDVSTHWAKDNINACVQAGIVSGYPDGTFRPNNNATRAEASKMVSVMMEKK